MMTFIKKNTLNKAVAWKHQKKWMLLSFFTISFLSAPGLAQDSKSLGVLEKKTEGRVDFPGTLEGARDLLKQFLDTKIDNKALTLQLRPRVEDFKAVFQSAAAKKAFQAYQKAWDEGKIVIRHQADQTELKILWTHAKDLQTGEGMALAFPAGYVRIASYLKPGITWYQFKFIRPGQELGFAWDGLLYVNGRWVIFPKPWRVL